MLYSSCCCLSTAQAQDNNLGLYDRSPPRAGQMVNIMYSISANNEVGVADAPFNTCSATETGTKDYAYLTFAPKNATINFYKDTQCREFAYGLDGYYIGNPGPAKSFRWVGWTEDVIGRLFEAQPFQGQGDAAHGGYENGGGSPVVTPQNPVIHQPQNPQQDGHHGQTGADADDSSPLATFFGGALGSLVVLSIGGVIFWKTAAKRLMDEGGKGKSVLPYDRIGGDPDNDVLLTAKSRSENAFELEAVDEADNDHDSEDDDSIESEGSQSRERRQQKQRLVRQDLYHGDEHV
ncbi:hypothetical protein EDD11_003295 [Mortierella claussenii]|nr:hypothetical protein EDD11_003295 [Mortierella claussenii]